MVRKRPHVRGAVPEDERLMNKRFIAGLAAVLILLSGLVPVRAEQGGAFEEMAGKRAAVQTGTVSGEVVQSIVPDIQLEFFNTQTDCLAALRAGKVDTYCGDEPTIRFMMLENPDIEIYGKLKDFDFAAVFPKTDEGRALCDQYNAFVDELWANGTMAEIDTIWFGADDEKRTVLDYEVLPDTNGTLRMAVDTSMPPFAYVKDNRVVGYDVDIAARFCEANGYLLEVEQMSFPGILPSVQTGKSDFAACSIAVTEERAESVLFSHANYHGGTVLAVMKNAGDAETAAAVQPEFSEFSDLSGKTVSMLTGAPFEELVRSKAPGVGEFTFFNSTPDLIQALKTDKTDAFLMNNAVGQLILNKNPDLALFPRHLQDGTFGLAFAKGDSRRDEWQAAYDAIPQAEIQRAWDKWSGADDSVKSLPEQDWAGANGTVRAAVCDTLEPVSYVGENGELMGFDLEIILMIARELDVKVVFSGMEFSAVLAEVQSGKADIGAGSIIITDERAEAVDFLEYYPAAFVLIVRSAGASGAGANGSDSFLSGIASSFEKTFIRENRWVLFVEGVGTSMLITLLAILFGTLLGFAVFMLCRNGNPAANAVTRFATWLVQGMPMVVLLMILYYIVFGKASIGGISVAVIGFTLTFGAAVFGILKMGVGAVDRGQYEAAYALGYSGRRTFFTIILPQALPHALPAYKGEIVSLIKATAVVGYIAVQDLTKMGDIVRSRTYEAFFPLIAVTVIYFALEGLIGLLVKHISVNIDPRRRRPEEILKGVKTGRN